MQANMHISKLFFDLQDQRPVRRNRFWCYLLRNDLPKIDIALWPVTQCYRTVGAIMPLDAMWDDLTEAQVEWDPSELAIYLDSGFGSDRRVLQAPTVLHSWGHINRTCPCGCRAAFNLTRLRAGGARGFGQISSKSGCHRHLGSPSMHSASDLSVPNGTKHSIESSWSNCCPASSPVGADTGANWTPTTLLGMDWT